MKKKKLFYGWIIVLVCMLLTAGSTGLLSYLSALFVEPVTTGLGFGRTEFTVYSTFTTVTSMLVMPVIGDIYKRFQPKVLILFGACCGAGAMFLFASASGLISFYIGAVFAGIGITFCGGMPVAILLNNWFNEKRGLVTGIAFTGPGIVSAAFSPVISMIITSWGWRHAYLAIGITILVMLVPATVFLIRLKPADMGLKPYGTATEQVKTSDDNIGFTRAEALKMPAFWLFALSLLLVGIITYGTQQHMVAFWTESGAGAEAAARAYSVAMLIAAFAKIAIGGIFDKYSVRNASILCGFVTLGAMVSLNLCTSGVAVMIPVLMFGVTATLQVMLPTYLTAKLFGQKDYGALYGLLSSVLFLGAGVGIPLSSAIYDLTDGYTLAWALYAVLSIMLTAAMVFADHFSKKEFSAKYSIERKH